MIEYRSGPIRVTRWYIAKLLVHPWYPISVNQLLVVVIRTLVLNGAGEQDIGPILWAYFHVAFDFTPLSLVLFYVEAERVPESLEDIICWFPAPDRIFAAALIMAYWTIAISCDVALRAAWLMLVPQRGVSGRKE